LISFLTKTPAISGSIGHGAEDSGLWWVKFGIDVDHPLAWHVVQGLGHVLNYVSIDERLPTVFMPVSPPPYLNGGPGDFLSWVIETTAPDFHPDTATEWLASRLPEPIDDESQWLELDD